MSEGTTRFVALCALIAFIVLCALLGWIVWLLVR